MTNYLEGKTQTMSSREIAELTGKRHSDLMRDIRNMEPAWEEINGRKFALVELPDQKGELRPCYNLTKIECLYIGTKFNDVSRAKLIMRWEKLENERQKPISFEEMAKQTIILADKRIKALEAKIQDDKPKVNFANAISGTTSNIDFETFAKVIYDQQGIRIGRNRLMKWFRDSGFMTKANKPYQNIVDRGLMMLKEGSYINQSTNELVTYTQPRITGKGQIYFLNKIIDEKINN